MTETPHSDAGKMRDKARAFVRELVARDGPAFDHHVATLARLGASEIAFAVACTERAPRAAASTGDATITAQVERLRAIATDLDPGRREAPGLWQRLFGAAPAPADTKGYFNRYEAAQDAIADVLRRLAEGCDDLVQANFTHATQKARLDDALDRLDRAAGMAALLDTQIEAAAREMALSDPARATALRTTALTALRSRAVDLATHQTIATQGRLALDIVVQNNLALIEGVTRASAATIAALRVAITAADAIAHQHIVLDRIARVDALAADATADPEAQHAALQAAFGDVHGALDALDGVRARALGKRAVPLT